MATKLSGYTRRGDQASHLSPSRLRSLLQLQNIPYHKSDGVVFYPPTTAHPGRELGSPYLRMRPILSTLYLFLANILNLQLLLGFITIVPWFALILFDAGLWLYRILLWELPWVGGRARGQQRPRAPSLNERPDGQRRAFGLRGVESDSGPDQESEGDTLADGNAGKENMAPTAGASHSSVDGEVKHRAGRA